MSPITNYHLYCQQKVLTPGSISYYRLRFTKIIWQHPENLSAVTAVLAFCKEITDIAHECPEHSVAQQKFAWWQTELQRLQTHAPTHPVMHALLELILQDHSLMEWLMQFFLIHQQKLSPIHFLTQEELIHHCHETQGLQEMMVAKVLHADDETTLTICQKLGVTLELIRLISELRMDIRRDLLLLPEALLEKYKLDTKSLYQLKESSALTALLTELAELARNYYQEAQTALNSAAKQSLQSTYIASGLNCELLRAIQDDGFQVFSHQILLPPLRLCWKAWRISQQM